ncbi:MAG: glycoside hydrolase family 3 protein [Armatimonadota bacterium]
MNEWVSRTFAGLTVEEKVGQVICYRAGEWADETLEMARKGLVGCVSPLYYEGMSDFESAVGFMNALQEASPIPVLFLSSWAHERPQWGTSPLPSAGSAMALGATRDTELAYQFGRVAARESKAVGFDLVWEPCVDVNTNPRNPIIATRSFGDRPELVTEMALAVVRGMQEERVLPNAKHFPGHGDTDFDTHRELGTVPHDRARLEAVELYPYRRLIAAGLRGVETAHLIFPALEPDTRLPATFSRRCIHDLLRADMGFEGLIVSDSLTMKAIKDNYSVAESLVRTFNAGHDILLQDYNEPPMPSFQAVLDAVNDGSISMEMLDAAVLRVLEAKAWAGLPERGRLTAEGARAVFRQPEHIAVARRIFESSVTVLEKEGLPLRGGGARVCVVGTRAPGENEAMADFASVAYSSRETFFREIAARLDGVKTHVLDEEPDAAQIAAAVASTEGSDTVVFAPAPRVQSYKLLSAQASGGQIEFARRVLAAGKRLCLCVLGSPYVITRFPGAPICLTTYSPDTGAAEAAVRVLFGEVPSRGKLPVTLSESYPFGYGLD